MIEHRSVAAFNDMLRKLQPTWYRPIREIRVADLFDGRMEKHGVSEYANRFIPEGRRFLTDGKNYLWVSEWRGAIEEMIECRADASDTIISAIAQELNTEIVSHFQPRYWQVEAEVKWPANMSSEDRASEHSFYVEASKRLHGLPNEIKPGTIGMRLADTVEELVAADPDLLGPHNEYKLLSQANAIFGHRYRVPKKASYAESSTILFDKPPIQGDKQSLYCQVIAQSEISVAIMQVKGGFRCV